MIVVKTLQCWAFVWECGTSWISYMSDSCSLSPPSGLRIKMLGLLVYLAIRGLYLIKISRIIHLYPCQWNNDRSIFQKSDVMKSCTRRVYSLKRIGTFFPYNLIKLTESATLARHVQQSNGFCTHGHYMCAYCGQIQSRGFASLWFISNTWFIDISGASFRHRSKLCSPANRARPAWMKRPSVNIQHRPVRVSCRQKKQETSPLWRVGPVGPIII